MNLCIRLFESNIYDVSNSEEIRFKWIKLIILCAPSRVVMVEQRTRFVIVPEANENNK